MEALLKIAAVHSLVMSAGALAGNFLGHLGILLMTLVGVGLYLYNIIAFTDIFFSDENNPLYKVYRGLENIPLALQGILAPIRPLTYTGDLSLDLIASLIIMIILYFIIGLIWLKRSEPERSQMLVLSRPESKYIGFFAALTTANIIGNIGIRVGAYSIIAQGVFVLSLIISYKFYSILFKSRIGLS